MFKWRDAYSCKVKEMDDQHKNLFRLGSELNRIMSSRDGEDDHYDEIMAVLKELKDYTAYHFNSEEELMQKYGYEGLEKQKEEHRAFIEKIMEFETEDIDLQQRKFSMEVLIFIADWIENHIVKSDKSYGDFLNQRGVY